VLNFSIKSFLARQQRQAVHISQTGSDRAVIGTGRMSRNETEAMPQNLHSRPRVAIGRATKSVPPVSVIFVGLHFRALPKCKADKPGNRAEGKQGQQPVRHIRIRCSGPRPFAALFVSVQLAGWAERSETRHLAARWVSRRALPILHELHELCCRIIKPWSLSAMCTDGTPPRRWSLSQCRVQADASSPESGPWQPRR
jgi:hypothetical protein